MPSKTRTNWTKPELKLAFYLYCQLPFGKLHYRNPLIQKLASQLGRTPAAVAMKLVNFASLDPFIQASGRLGLRGASKLDREVWDEFHNNWEGLTAECQPFFDVPAETSESPVITKVPEITERKATVTTRIGQTFFRQAVLASYGEKCCMSNTAIPELLIASHIIPWSEGKERLNPANGLCLSAIHDMAFDKGFMTVFPDFSIGISEILRKHKTDFNAPITLHLCQLEGAHIRLPEKFLPKSEFLEWHNKHIFLG